MFDPSQLAVGFCSTNRFRAAGFAASLLAPSFALAQTTGPIIQPPVEAAAPQAVKPSIMHAFAKAMTLKVGATALAGSIFYAGTGSLVDTGALLVLGNIGATGIFMANDYLWDHLSPNTNVSANNQSFDAMGSAWRNTQKYLTFKPAMAIWAWGSTYLYTGSVAATVTMGSAAFFAFPAVFYANNMAWDWYDWHATSGAAAPPAASGLVSAGLVPR